MLITWHAEENFTISALQRPGHALVQDNPKVVNTVNTSEIEKQVCTSSMHILAGLL